MPHPDEQLTATFRHTRRSPFAALNGLAARIREVWHRILGRSDTDDSRVHQLERRIRALEQKSKGQRAKWESARARLKRAADAHHRRILSPDVVHDLLPLRARTIAARAKHADAVECDTHHQRVSTSYGQALSSILQPDPYLARTTVQGLPWWVPVPRSLSRKASKRFVEKQRFPYRTITQTREFAVGSILIDIGANTGRMSIPRVILGDIERAYCAEPDPLNFAALVRNIADNGLRGLVLPDRVAIGSECGPIRLRQAKYPGGHQLLTSERSGAGSIEVPCWTLDEWCQRLSIDPDLVAYVKVDTQGWEGHVLRGAAQLLDRPHIVWQLEVAPALLDAAGTPARELYEVCAARFSHFIDLDKRVEGPRVRQVQEMRDALEHLREGDVTDIVLFNAGGRLDTVLTAPAVSTYVDKG